MAERMQQEQTVDSKDSKRDAGKNPEISIIIPVYNATATISKTLSSLERLDFPAEQLEIILVDDGSTDNTLDVLRKWGAANKENKSLPKVSIIKQKNQGPGAARNNGVKNSKANLVYFTDSDCAIKPDCIKQLFQKFRDDVRLGAVGGAIELPPEERNIWAVADHYASWYHHNPRLKPHYVRSTPTANLMVKKEVFETIGYFKEKIKAGEDVEFGARMEQAGYKFYSLNTAYVYHYNRTSLKDFFRHAYKWGYFGASVRINNPATKYHYLFPANIFLASLYFIPLFLMQFFYIMVQWLKAGDFKVLLYWPFIFLRCISYQWGVLRQTKDYNKNKNKQNT